MEDDDTEAAVLKTALSLSTDLPWQTKVALVGRIRRSHHLLRSGAILPSGVVAAQCGLRLNPFALWEYPANSLARKHSGEYCLDCLRAWRGRDE